MRNMKTVPYDGIFTLSAPSPKWVWNAQGVLVEVPAGQPAWDHDPVTGEPLGQRIESVDATNINPWFIDIENLPVVGEVSVSSALFPDSQSYYRYFITTSSSSRGYIYGENLTGGVTYTLSSYSEPGDIDVVTHWNGGSRVLSRFNVATGQVGYQAPGVDARMVPVPGGYRCISTFQAAAPAWNVGQDFIVGDGETSLKIGGIQIEEGNEATSPIYTNGSAVTRAADALDVDAIAGGVDRGSILVRCQLTEGAPVLSFDGTALVTAPDDDSHVYVVSYDGTETLISIDGADTTTGAGITPSLPLNVFRDSSSAGSGYIEDLVFSPIKKTAAQVKAASAAGEL